MATSILEQYRISDLIEWYNKKTLVINKDFQRRSVWTTSAKIFLIDTILRELPIPKIYIRTKVDLKTKKSYREVVDGQQRLLAIIDFSKDSIILSRKTNEFSGLKYSTLGDELQEKFLSYAVSIGQLINASDDDVLEIFSRLNSNTVKLNNQELRHAQFQGMFKWSVFEASRALSPAFEKYKVLTLKQRLRMLDDQLVAEMFGIILKGITDGGQRNIQKLYKEFDRDDSFNQEEVENKIIKTTDFIFDNFSFLFESYNSFAKSPHFLILFGAVSHAIFGIPEGAIGDSMPASKRKGIPDLEIASKNLEVLANIIEFDETPDDYKSFAKAVASSTQRISSRKERFITYYDSLF